LEASTALLKELPAHAGMATVIVQHLGPHHKSLLRELLSRVTGMPVTQVEDGVVPEMRHVYVIAPDKDVILWEGALRLASRQQAGGRQAEWRADADLGAGMRHRYRRSRPGQSQAGCLPAALKRARTTSGFN
jgi:hypothetical protein